MNEAARKTLRNHLKKAGQHDTLEQLKMWAAQQAGLYQEEGDKYGEELFQDVLALIEEAGSLEALRKV